MLTDLLLRLTPAQAHWVLRVMRVDLSTFHSWMEGMCPCGAEGLEEVEAA